MPEVMSANLPDRVAMVQGVPREARTKTARRLRTRPLSLTQNPVGATGLLRAIAGSATARRSTLHFFGRRQQFPGVVGQLNGPAAHRVSAIELSAR